MREDAQNTETSESQETEPAKSGVLVLVLTLLLALGAGTGLGLFLVGPRIVAAHSAPHKEKKDKKQSEVQPTFTFENVVVNPSGSNGTRFVIATVAVDVETAQDHEALRTKESAIRDAIASALSARTLTELAMPNAREILKADLRVRIARSAGVKGVKQVYLPQYVLQ